MNPKILIVALVAIFCVTAIGAPPAQALTFLVPAAAAVIWAAATVTTGVVAVSQPESDTQQEMASKSEPSSTEPGDNTSTTLTFASSNTTVPASAGTE